MKKLISLLSILIISGTAVPTTIAASPYQKEEKLNNKINYKQTNNLKKINRTKRSWDSQSRNENKINRQCYWDVPCDYWLWISRNNWIKTQKIYNKSEDYDEFKNPFFSIIKSFWRECGEGELWGIIKAVWNDFSTINNKYISSRVNYGLYMKIYKGQRLARGSNDLQLQCWDDCDVSWYKKKIKFLGLNNDYKGEIGLDVDSKKILFFGNDEKFHYYFDGKKLDSKEKNYNKIYIKDANNEIVKSMIIYGNESMQDIITQYDLHNGIDYGYGYNIEIWSAEPKRTYFIMNNNNTYFYYDVEKPKTQSFMLINDNFLEFNFYIKEHFGLALEWQENFNTWKNEIDRQIKEDLPMFNVAQKRSWKGDKLNLMKDKILSLKHILKTIENSESINKLKYKVTKLQNDFSVLNNKIEKLSQEIDRIQFTNSDLEACTNGGSLISATTGWIPIIGTVISTISGTISAICGIANT